jgi:hypothetical protein
LCGQRTKPKQKGRIPYHPLNSLQRKVYLKGLGISVDPSQFKRECIAGAALRLKPERKTNVFFPVFLFS